VSKKYYKPQHETPDIHEEDKAMQRKLLESIMQKCKEDPVLAKMGWTLVLFKFEVILSFFPLDSADSKTER